MRDCCATPLKYGRRSLLLDAMGEASNRPLLWVGLI
jgi:hypothetical protein